MKNKLTKTKFNCASVVAAQLFSRVTCLGAIVLICASASAQNLFLSAGNSIYEFTPNGVEITFASGLNGPGALTFDEWGNLFVADSGTIDRFTAQGVRSTFASGLDGPQGLAFDGAGNLFVTDSLDIVPPGHAHIYKFTPGGA